MITFSSSVRVICRAGKDVRLVAIVNIEFGTAFEKR